VPFCSSVKLDPICFTQFQASHSLHVMIVMHSRYTIKLVSIAGIIVNLRTPPTRHGEVRFKVRDEAKAFRAASETRELLAW
jgi:hypothetical protein